MVPGRERQTRADPRVAALAQFLMLDDEPDRAHRTATKPHWRTWQSGLRFADGTPKPLYDAFRLPSSCRPGPGLDSPWSSGA